MPDHRRHRRRRTTRFASTSKLRRNVTSLAFFQMATFLVSIFTVTIVPKHLGPHTYGVLAFSTAFVGFFALASTLGSRQFLVMTIARDRSVLGRYTFNALCMKVALGGVIMALAILVGHLLGYPSQTQLLIEVSSFTIVIGSLTDVFSGALQGTERMTTQAFWYAAQLYVGAAVAIGLLLDHGGVVVYAIALTAATIIPLVTYAHAVWPDMKGHLELDLRLWKKIAAGGIPFSLWSAILLVYGSVDILMLQQMTGSTTVGWYALAYTWVGIPVAFPALLSTAVFPALSARAVELGNQFERTVNRAVQLAVFTGTPMAVGIALTAPDILDLFHYPTSYHRAALLIRILAFHIPIVGLDMVLALALAAQGRQKSWLVVGGIASVFNPLVNLFAIPFTSHHFGDGAIGASVVTVATELLMMAGAIYLRPAGVLDRSTISFAARCVLASGAMIPPVLLADSSPFAVKVLIGLAAFVIACLALRIVSIRDSRDVAGEFLKRLRGGGGVASLSSGTD
jgi:O-antigen/teichoic acid export membrane protein